MSYMFGRSIRQAEGASGVGRSRGTVKRPAVAGLLLTCLLSLLCSPAAAAPTAAQEAGRRAPVADGAATATEAAAAPTVITPLIGDFDGDHRSDVFMYGPGSLPDHVWLGRPDRAFRGTAAKVGRSYLPLVGDFNGNGHADIFWYGPGSRPDVLWYGKTDGRSPAPRSP